MTQISKRNSVSYYFRIEFSTLQGKITSGFCMVGVLGAMLVGIACWVLLPALQQSQYIVNTLDASERQLITLAANSEKAVQLVNYRMLMQEMVSAEEIQTIKDLLQPPLDSLSKHSANWKTAEASLSLKVASLKTESLLKAIKSLRAQSQEQHIVIYDQEILPLQQTIIQQLEKIQQLHMVEKKSIQASIMLRSDRLWMILSGCFACCVVIGGAFAAYIILRVLQEIKMLKNKILELSEGKLIETIPANRNELNSIIKAVNTLTDNLRNIQHFAQEVGSGNFDSNITVFEGQHELGESLAGMRNSLKTVALEEKQRHWVTVGLAQFSELLRTSSDDLSTYYQNIISELVRYLKINQAAIYVADLDELGRQNLELKASYAYGRLKYNHKIIEPGQGLVGQVYLEKQALFLRHIPVNYLQISSGLGEASPRYLVIMPLMVNDTVNGVLELASFHELAAHEIEFLKKITENISGALQNVSNVQTTARLLQEAQSMAEAVQAQEEMLRQNSEELIATQEQLSRDLEETNQKLALLEEALQQSSFPQLLLTADGYVQLANKKAADYFHQPVQDRPIQDFIQQDALTQFIVKAAAGNSFCFNYTHISQGEATIYLHAFSRDSKTFINLQLIPQALVALS